MTNRNRDTEHDTPVLSVANVTARRDGRPVLKGVSLEIMPGEIFGLLGPNGAGKSTTIAAITGLLPIAGGSVALFGQPGRAGDPEVHRQIGVLPENGGFYDWMTAPAYLAFFARLYGADHSSSRVQGLLDAVRLAPDENQPIAAFSRGMKQRLGLARALIGEPKLLILDEPTNGLDPRGRREVHNILLELATRGVAILMCTHILDDVERLCSRIGVIVGGRTVATGEIGELVGTTRHGDRFELLFEADAGPSLLDVHEVAGVTVEGHDDAVRAFVRVAPDRPVHTLWSEMIAAGWPIAEIRREGSGLEDFYLSVTDTDATREDAA